ncbi:NUDIX hydrolase [Sabulicella glaciei]|uniref:NUDIX hydrolase n=1 Tax=Sabulicella glaciei TaxID=2984948 RepID=A0ABT3NS23_9PROT|nr:NUDIX hydrolase [Roseococcus sp. MDT2-1-1]MCW8084963.1 NUDIX hydrolase [Roseococcus sp. MDT2-1-1]
MASPCAERRRARPRDAASLLLYRESSARGVELLMGRRHRDLRFMPGMLVFPGGRVDRADYRAPVAAGLPGDTAAQLGLSARPSLAKALGVCAARELEEETGLRLGGAAPDLSGLAYLTRAITPATFPIRFHARFLLAPAEMALGEMRGSGELEELRFFTPDELAAAPHARITAMIVEEFLRWRQDPARPLIRITGRDSRLPERLRQRP